MQKSPIKGKLKKIFAKAKGVDTIAIVNTSSPDPNFLYITGYTSGVFEYDLLLLTREGVYHVTSVLEYDTAMQQKHPEIEIILRGPKEAKYKKLMSSLIKGKTLGINGEVLPVALLEILKSRYSPKKVADVSEALKDARMIKTEFEIAEIRKAIGITKWAMLKIQADFKEGVTERQIAAKFDYISSTLGSAKPSFDTIVCFGKNAALPHHMPNDTKLVKGDFILIDAGAKVNNYCSDLTRTFLFGESDPAKKKMYDTVQQAKVKSIHAIKVGKSGAQIHKIAADYINKAENGEYKGKFIHALGHSLGIEVHDGPGFSPNAKQKLKPGMVITVEPGIYVVGYGGVRIEDDILITKDGPIIL